MAVPYVIPRSVSRGVTRPASDRLFGSSTGASRLLAGNSDGIALDFTDQSIVIRDTTTPGNVYAGVGIVVASAVAGPGFKLTYTSPSAKMTRQSDGLYRYNAHNLYLNSAAPANQSITVISGLSYTVTITGSVSVTASGAATGVMTAGSTVFTAATGTLTFGSTSGAGTVHVRRTESNTDYIGTAGAVRYALPYEWDTSGNCLGILPELVGTNIMLWSQDFSNAAWTKTGATVVADNVVSPGGLTNADTITASTANSIHGISQNATVAAASTVTAYAIVKRVDWDYITFNITDGVSKNYAVLFNIANGTVIGNHTGFTSFSAPVSSSISDVGNGWYMLTVTATLDAGRTTAGPSVYLAQNGNPLSSGAYVGAGQSFALWHMQEEVSSVTSSPIVTAGATVTRAVDQISIADTLFPTSTTGMLLFAQFIARSLNASRYVCYGNGAQSNYFEIVHNSNNQVRGASDGTNAITISNFTAYTSGTVKAAHSVKLNEARMAVNGVDLTPDTTCTVPNPDALYLTGRIVSFGTMHSHIQKVMLLPRAAADQAEVNALTV